MLAGLYVAYVMILAKVRTQLAPPLPDTERHVAVPAANAAIAAARGARALPALVRALAGPKSAVLPAGHVSRQLLVVLFPAIAFAVLMGLTWNAVTRPDVQVDLSAISISMTGEPEAQAAGLAEPIAEAAGTGLAEPPVEDAGTGLAEPSAGEGAPALAEPPGNAAPDAAVEPRIATSEAATATPRPAKAVARDPTPKAIWIVLAIGAAILALFYATLTFVRLEVFKMLLASFFPLALLILAVLGTIVFGLATPTEAAAIGAFGGFALAAAYALAAKPAEVRRRALRTWVPLWLLFGVSVIWFLLLGFEVLPSGPPRWVGWISVAAIAVWCVLSTAQMKLWGTVRESAFLTAKTSAMVCWLFVGSSIFSAAFALLGGQEIVERWVLSLGLTPIQFMILAQVIIFLLGWPLEWTEIIVIFMPIFIPLLAKFNIDPLFFGLLVALNLQTAFLSPPVAMAAFYLKGVSPPHVTLNSIFAGMLPFMGIQVVALALLYVFPDIGLWLPRVLYK
jgi:TRAP-type mannitol/chloroaromatic compound transport system permease large subunit